MNKRTLIAMIAICCTPVYASNFYLNLGAGGVLSSSKGSFSADSTSTLYSPTAVGTSLFILPNVAWNNKFNNGFDVNIALGYQFTPNWRSDIEFLYQRLTRDIDGSYDWREINSVSQVVYAQSNGNPITHTTSNVNLYSFLTNGYYDFKNNTKWTPSIGAGIGIAWLNSDGTSAMNTLNVDDPSTPLVETAPANQRSPSLYGTAFAWQFKLGISYQWDERRSIALAYRLFGTSQFKAGNSTITTNPNTSGSTRFNIAQHDISGILTNSLELNLKFDI